jgi:DNA-binding response OmpR family regulator
MIKKMEKKQKILVVEDEPTLRKTMTEFLGMEGFDVCAASDGEMAVAVAKKEKPDLILLDIILPKKDGFGVLDEIKSDRELKIVPIILLTNLDTAEDIQRAFEKGITTYLVKSDYKLEDVVAKIKETLKT